MLKDEEIKVRVPGSVKSAIREIAESRLTSESEIAREALIDYLARRGIGPAQLREGHTTTPMPVPKPESKYPQAERPAKKLSRSKKN